MSARAQFIVTRHAGHATTCSAGPGGEGGSPMGGSGLSTGGCVGGSGPSGSGWLGPGRLIAQ
ncbi:hypothetical protein [Candidatus Viadribacter manganicus]|uniref:hypothetical protein n=1 Tax=Candidatus Viadribacter manganicus TaxID=1759059 RepID=UPI000A5A9872|nr:hypothetical protein [Candidatus Viadribacter manganicus]